MDSLDATAYPIETVLKIDFFLALPGLQKRWVVGPTFSLGG